ncbi:MAG: elongation factor 1-beta [Methanomassiliicoccales archaeon]
MGKVAVTFNLLPEDTTFDMEGLKNRLPGLLPEGVQPYKAEVKPFAFGLKALEIICIMDDANNVLEELEEKLRSIEGIQTVENTGITLI